MKHRSSLAAFTIVAALVAAARANVKTTDETWHDAARERDVPVRIYLDDATTRPAPTILLSHGLGGTREAMGYAADAWAAHGYVVVSLQHVGSDDSVWRGVDRDKRVDALRDAMNVQTYVDRCRDVRFAIDELALRDNETGVLKDRVDLDHLGIAGHSFGAQTVQAIIGQRLGTPQHPLRSLSDRRIVAAVAFSPSYTRDQPKWAFADVKVPCFHFTGTKDTVAEVHDVSAAERRAPFDAIPAGEQYLLTIDGGDHAVFGGTPGRVEPKEYAAWHALIVDLTTHFWDAELRGDAAAKQWLASQAKDVIGTAGTFESQATTRPADGGR